ncbi:hypothetical protein BGX20_007189 [Mortierella sp. AD010]|nr:hypothetical protein BGX20_007189 [Mortierella sp. AD010]
MPRSWSPPLDVNTRTITSVSVVRAKLEHLDAIHNIQLKAYKDRKDFHESPEVFKAKLESYPAGNFVAIVTSSVVTNDDTSTWVGKDTVEEEEDEKEKGSEGNDEGTAVEEVQDDSAMDQDIGEVHEVTVIEITETTPDGSTTTTTETTNLTEETHIVRARTPDVVEGDDIEDEGATFLSSSTFKRTTTLGPGPTRSRKGESRNEDEDGEDDFTTVLFQWEEPVGYLFSHPYSRESMRLHHVGGVGSEAATKTATATEPSKTKKMRLEAGEETTDTESEEDPFDHDQLMEKYYIHDCAIHPDWRGKGLASKLWKALEESLTPANQNELLSKEGLVDTEEEDEGEEEEEVSSSSTPAQTQKGHHPHRHRRHRKRSRKAHRRKGAPNLKEIVLVSVQGTRPFWERTAGFQVVTDHDMDLSGYGDEALLMRKPFIF